MSRTDRRLGETAVPLQVVGRGPTYVLTPNGVSLTSLLRRCDVASVTDLL